MKEFPLFKKFLKVSKRINILTFKSLADGIAEY